MLGRLLGRPANTTRAQDQLVTDRATTAVRPPAIAMLAMVLVAAALGWASAAKAAPPGQGPGGPVLVIGDPADPFGSYYAEILTAEGLNAFEVRDIGQVSGPALSGYSVVVLAQMGLSAPQASMLSSWVAGGGNLIAMRPDPALAGLLGLGGDLGDLDNGYLKVDSSSGPAAGISGDTMQFHGRADRWTLAGAAKVADLYASATSATPHAAVTLHSVGTAGGQAAAFTYDLARSVVYTRQGNPAWAGDERDAFAPIRSDDLFFGASLGDVQPDWIDLNKVAIPQADEQQRLLANLITQMSIDRVPLPRFWYLPRGEKAVVVMTGDDHQPNGTVGHFNRFLALSPPGCSVPDWECVRSTSYTYGLSNMTDSVAAGYQAQGFEIALHLNTSCNDFTEASLRADWGDQLPALRAKWPSLAAPRTNRTHCVVWSDWAGQPTVERDFGIRLDTNYYYWPGSWVQNRPGMFTGSGLPMRFANLDGSPIDVYQATTQLTDESGIDIPAHIAALLDRAAGPQGYYGAFTANIHTDRSVGPAEAIVAAARARGVPVISSAQLLAWLDGRNDSSFGGLNYDGRQLRFTLNHAAGARGLEAMVPAATPAGRLLSLSRNGAPVAVATRTVKGIEYLVFAAAQGDYVAAYSAVPQPSGSGAPAEPAAPDTKASRARIRPNRVRVSRRGVLKLKVSCPGEQSVCRVDLKLRRGGVTLARAKFRVGEGKTRKVSLRLTRGGRRTLARSASLRVVALAAARDEAGNRATTRTRIRLLAP